MQKERRFNVGDIFYTNNGKLRKYKVINIVYNNYYLEYYEDNRNTHLLTGSIFSADKEALDSEIINSPLFQVMMELKSSSE